MRSVFMNQNTVVIEEIVCVAADVRTLVANQYLFIRTVRQPLCQHAAGKTCSYN